MTQTVPMLRRESVGVGGLKPGSERDSQRAPSEPRETEMNEGEEGMELPCGPGCGVWVCVETLQLKIP